MGMNRWGRAAFDFRSCERRMLRLVDMWPALPTLAALLLLLRLGLQYRALQRLRSRLSPSSPSPSPAQTQLSVLTQNLWLHYFVPAPFRSVRVRAFLAHLQQQPPIDVVVIQEAFLLRLGPIVLYEYVSELVDGMDALGYHWWSDMRGSLPRIYGQNSGVIVFSRLPLVAPPHEEVFIHSDEVLNCKGFACVRLALAGATLAVIGTHLDSRRRAAKELQMAQISAYLKRALSDSTSVIVAGDFNTCPRTWGNLRPGTHVTDDYASLRDRLHPLVNATECEDDAQWLRTHYVTPSRATLYSQQLVGTLLQAHWPNELSSASLDHIFFSPNSLRPLGVSAASWEAPAIRGPVSDHVGVIARFSTS